MTDWVTILTLLNSSIITLVGIIQLIKYWKRPKLEIEIQVPISRSEVKNKILWVLFKNLNIHIINSGNEDVFIRNLKIEHIESTTNLPSWKSIDRDFNLPARQRKDYLIDFDFSYNPRENERGGKWDNISVIADYGKNKKVWERFYFIIGEKGTMSVFSSENSWDKL